MVNFSSSCMPACDALSNSFTLSVEMGLPLVMLSHFSMRNCASKEVNTQCSTTCSSSASSAQTARQFHHHQHLFPHEKHRANLSAASVSRLLSCLNLMCLPLLPNPDCLCEVPYGLTVSLLLPHKFSRYFISGKRKSTATGNLTMSGYGTSILLKHVPELANNVQNAPDLQGSSLLFLA